MVRKRKTLQELTIKDNFMFAAVMLEPSNAKGLLERALGIKVDHVEISYEKSIVYNPEYKGVRLDVFLKDDAGTHFNVEMQAASQKLEKRARYYHDQIDMEMLVSGAEYESLPDNYVIFICDYDPLGLKKYKYTVRHTLAEDGTYEYADGRHTVFLSTVGTNEKDVPEALANFLKYVAAEPEDSDADYDDSYVTQLQNSVKKIKNSRDMGGRYMIFEEMMRKEYKSGHDDGVIEGLERGRSEGLERGRSEGLEQGRSEGKLEGKLESVSYILSSRFTISDDLSKKLQMISNEDALQNLLIAAAKAVSVEEFEKELTEVLPGQVESTEKI